MEKNYNTYLVRGSFKIDPAMSDRLLTQLKGIDRVDYVISPHAEEDHSGTVPHVLSRYPGAKVISTPKAKGMLIDFLASPMNLS